MKSRKTGKRRKENSTAGGKLRAGASQNPKLGVQARKLLGKHYASKYQTMRRG